MGTRTTLMPYSFGRTYVTESAITSFSPTTAIRSGRTTRRKKPERKKSPSREAGLHREPIRLRSTASRSGSEASLRVMGVASRWSLVCR